MARMNAKKDFTMKNPYMIPEKEWNKLPEEERERQYWAWAVTEELETASPKDLRFCYWFLRA